LGEPIDVDFTSEFSGQAYHINFGERDEGGFEVLVNGESVYRVTGLLR
jgi:hypothetical protein